MSVNRFTGLDGQSRERLVVVPGQFKASAAGIGTQRLYQNLQFELFHAPASANDFVKPNIWQAQLQASSSALRFRAQVSDDSKAVQRVVVLYRTTTTARWSKAELTYNAATGWAEGSVPRITGTIEYVVQAVDATGNVAMALDHGNPFQAVVR